MKKLLTRYYLLLLLIIIAAGKSYALPAAAISHAEKASLEHKDSFGAAVLHGYTSIENYNLPHFEKQSDKIETSNNEEDEEEFSIGELLHQKKFTAVDYAFLSTFYAPAPTISVDTFIKYCPAGNYFHPLYSRQYILYEVFRI